MISNTIGDDFPEGGVLVVDVEIVGPAELVQACDDLFLQNVLAGGLHEALFDKLHGDGIGEHFGTVPEIAQGFSSGTFLGCLYLRQDACFTGTGSKNFGHCPYL